MLHRFDLDRIDIEFSSEGTQTHQSLHAHRWLALAARMEMTARRAGRGTRRRATRAPGDAAIASWTARAHRCVAVSSNSSIPNFGERSEASQLVFSRFGPRFSGASLQIRPQPLVGTYRGAGCVSGWRNSTLPPHVVFICVCFVPLVCLRRRSLWYVIVRCGALVLGRGATTPYWFMR